MRATISTLLGAGLLWSAGAAAHAHLIASVPADHAELTTAPTEAVLSFAEPVIVTAAKLVTIDGTKTPLGALPQGSLKEAHIPVPRLAPGSYRLQWRATSDDGHVMSGEFSFSVTGPAAK